MTTDRSLVDSLSPEQLQREIDAIVARYFATSDRAGQDRCLTLIAPYLQRKASSGKPLSKDESDIFQLAIELVQETDEARKSKSGIGCWTWVLIVIVIKIVLALIVRGGH